MGSADIIDGEVRSADIRNDDIQSGDVKDGSINTFDVHSFLGVDVVDGTLTSADIQDNSLGNGDFLDQSVDSRVVTNNSLLSSDLSTASVGSDEVTNDSLTAADVNESTLNVPHIPTTANFWFAQPATSENDVFVQVASKNLAAGDYVFLPPSTPPAAKAASSTSTSSTPSASCATPSGGVIGGTSDRRYVPGTDTIKRSLSFNGGASLLGRRHRERLVQGPDPGGTSTAGQDPQPARRRVQLSNGRGRDTRRAMSEENLQRVHEQYARYNAGERAPGRWFWHEDAEYHTAREDPDHAAHRGIEAIGKLFASWLEAYPDS